MNICEKQGYTPMHLAVQRDYFNIAQAINREWSRP
ncbi:MAG: hypothetical protein ACR5K2_04370 [Wolbachia sp.]